MYPHCTQGSSTQRQRYDSKRDKRLNGYQRSGQRGAGAGTKRLGGCPDRKWGVGNTWTSWQSIGWVEGPLNTLTCLGWSSPFLCRIRSARASVLCTKLTPPIRGPIPFLFLLLPGPLLPGLHLCLRGALRKERAKDTLVTRMSTCSECHSLPSHGHQAYPYLPVTNTGSPVPDPRQPRFCSGHRPSLYNQDEGNNVPGEPKLGQTLQLYGTKGAHQGSFSKASRRSERSKPRIHPNRVFWETLEREGFWGIKFPLSTSTGFTHARG